MHTSAKEVVNELLLLLSYFILITQFCMELIMGEHITPMFLSDDAIYFQNQIQATYRSS